MTGPLDQRRLLLDLLYPFRQRLLLVLALATGGALLVLASPPLIGQFSDIVLGAESSGQAVFFLVVLGVMAAARAVLQFASSYFAAQVSEELSAALRHRVFSHMIRLPLAWHTARRQGEHLSLITSDVDTLGDFATSAAMSLIPTLLTFLIALMIVGSTFPLVTLATLIVMPLFIFVTRRLGNKVRERAIALRQRYAITYGRAVEFLEAVTLLKAYGREATGEQLLKQTGDAVVESSRHVNRLQSLIMPLTQLGALLVILGLMWIASVQLSAGLSSPGELLTLLLYVMLVVRPLSQLAAGFTGMMVAQGVLTRLAETMREEPESAGGEHAIESFKRIEVEDLHFTYPGRANVLTGVSFSISAGERLAITGENGAGKTTLIGCLLAFHSPDSGNIRVDDVPVASLDRQSLRAQFSYVPQDTILLNDTVEENVRFGDATLSAEDVHHALVLAQAEPMLARLPAGQATEVGERGIELSGGEKQRVALARAIAADRPVLILDEATSMFDLASEEALVSGLEEWLVGRTLIVITHRPAMLAMTSRTIAVEGGVVRECS